MRIIVRKSAGPYIGPRGGKWADPQHTVPWAPVDVSADAVRSHVAAADIGGKHGHPATVGRVADVPHTKATVPLAHLDVIDPNDKARIADYAGRSTPMPAVQGGYNARSHRRGKPQIYVPNGNHRVAAAKLRGDTHIEVIMPTHEWQLWQSRKPEARLHKSAGPYIGPRGGKWADPQHTVPWKEDGFNPGRTLKIGSEDFKILGRTGDTLHLQSERSGKFDYPVSGIKAAIKQHADEAAETKKESDKYAVGTKVPALEFGTIEIIEFHDYGAVDFTLAGATYHARTDKFEKVKKLLSVAPTGHAAQDRFTRLRLLKMVESSLIMTRRKRAGDEGSGLAGAPKMNDRDHKDIISASLFTGHNVAAVRDPAKFDGEKSRRVRFGSGTVGVNMKEPATKTDYETAHKFITSLAAAPYDPLAPPKLHRGMRLTEGAAKALTAGATFDMGAISSWTGNETVAEGFTSPAKGTGSHPDWNQRVVFHCDEPKRGTFMDGLSEYPREDEIISSGKVKVLKSESTTSVSGVQVLHVYVEHI